MKTTIGQASNALSTVLSFSPLKWAAVAALGGAVALVGCGGSPAPQVAAANTTATIKADTPAAAAAAAAIVSTVVDKAFTFSTAVPALGTTAATTVTLSGSATAPTATIASAGKTATGVMTYGSCIFTILVSNIPELPVGTVRIVNPCSIQLQTLGAAANGLPVGIPATLILGTTNSAPVLATIVIQNDGAIATSGGGSIGSTTTTASTGGQ